MNAISVYLTEVFDLGILISKYEAIESRVKDLEYDRNKIRIRALIEGARKSYFDKYGQAYRGADPNNCKESGRILESGRWVSSYTPYMWSDFLKYVPRRLSCLNTWSSHSKWR